jgi:hypothetical protein
VAPTSCNKGVLDRSGQLDMAGNYAKASEAKKLLIVKDTHSDRHLYGRPHNFLHNRETVETKIVFKP